MPGGCSRTLAERRKEVVESPGVEDILLTNPGAASGQDAVFHEREISGRVRVGGDDNVDAAIAGEAEVGVFEVQSIGIGVAFECDAMFTCGIEDFFDVEWKGFATEEQATGGMGDDLRV